MNKTTLLIFVFLAAGVTARPADVATNAKLLFSDDFSGEKLNKEWSVPIPSFEIENGVMRGAQVKDWHGSIATLKIPTKDCIYEVKFRFEGARGFNLAWDDKALKEVHGGHICRVAVMPKQIRLADDKNGYMRNDIYAMRHDPKNPQLVAEAEKLVVGTAKVIPADLKPGEWHQLRIEILGDTMTVILDGKLFGSLKSPGIAHPTKSEVHLTVLEKSVLFDDVKLWNAAPSARP